MSLKASLTLATAALFAATLLLPSAAASSLAEGALPAEAPAEGFLRIDVSLVDGVATPTVSGAGDLAVECLDDGTGAVEAVQCFVDFAGKAITCHEVGVYLEVYSGNVGLTSACKTLAAGCGGGAGTVCSASSRGSSPGPWTCRVSGSGSFSGYCYVVYSENNDR